MNKNQATQIANNLSNYLLQLPPDKQAELLSQWTWNCAVLQQNKRLTVWCVILSGVLGTLGTVLGVLLGFVLAKYL